MNKLDLHAAPDRSDAEEATINNVLSRIGQFDGEALFRAEPDMIDGLLDTFRNMLNLNIFEDVFDVPETGRDWDDLGPWERKQWTALAATLRAVAMFYVDDEKAAQLAS